MSGYNDQLTYRPMRNPGHDGLPADVLKFRSQMKERYNVDLYALGFQSEDPHVDFIKVGGEVSVFIDRKDMSGF
jgi:hypothetical protein